MRANDSISGEGVKIKAASDLLVLADHDISFTAAQDNLYFTEKGFYVGLTFPGSAAIESVFGGRPGQKADPLQGLADLSPLTRTLARLSHSDNGLAAGAAALYVGVGGLNGIMAGPDAMLNNLTKDLSPQAILGSAGISISSWKNERYWSEGGVSELVADGDIVMKAGLDAILPLFRSRTSRLIAKRVLVRRCPLPLPASAALPAWAMSNGDYANVVEQNGIVAGDGGYAVDVGGKVDLTAGLIVSSAVPGLNKSRLLVTHACALREGVARVGRACVRGDCFW